VLGGMRGGCSFGCAVPGTWERHGTGRVSTKLPLRFFRAVRLQQSLLLLWCGGAPPGAVRRVSLSHVLAERRQIMHRGPSGVVAGKGGFDVLMRHEFLLCVWGGWGHSQPGC
jgi:hypothetical protein